MTNKTIDGTDTKLAPIPRPHRAKGSIKRRIYNVLIELGPAPFSGIYRWVNTDPKAKHLSKKQVTNALYQGCRSGQFLRNDKGIYSVAPYSFYKSRGGKRKLNGELPTKTKKAMSKRNKAVESRFTSVALIQEKARLEARLKTVNDAIALLKELG